MSDNNGLGDRILLARIAAGMSQQQVVDAMREAGHDRWWQNTFSRVERGGQSLRIDEASTLADVLGVSLNYLAGRGEDGGPDPVELRSRLEAILADVRSAWKLLRPYIEE